MSDLNQRLNKRRLMQKAITRIAILILLYFSAWIMHFFMKLVMMGLTQIIR
jgi:hypothetical protein